MTAEQHHRAFGVALVDEWAARCYDAMIVQAKQQYGETGTTWRTELDDATDQACATQNDAALAELATRRNVYIIEKALWEN